MKNKRLQAILKLINKRDSVIADVACDHAFLAIKIANLSHVQKVIASDINAGPLSSGKFNVENSKVKEKIEIVCADGISHIKNKIDVAIIAGIGGNLITKIINHKNSQNIKSFILQANNNVQVLRRFCSNNDYKVINEVIIRDNNIFYEIIKITKGRHILSEKEILLGPINIQNREKLFLEMCKNKLDYLNNNIPKKNMPEYVKKQIKILEEIVC